MRGAPRTEITFNFQEGFLLGELITNETKTITDNDQTQVKISHVIRINGCLPYPEGFHLYDGAGRVDSDQVKTFLGELAPKAVAWYTYKANTSNFMLTFREKLVHEQFAKLCNVPPEFFTCCRLISERSDNGATHSFSQSVVRYSNGYIEELPLHIENLSDPNTSYKPPDPVSPVYQNIVKDLRVNPEEAQGLNMIKKIEGAVHNFTSEMIEELAEAEKRLFEIDKEVRELAIAKRQREYNTRDEFLLPSCSSMDYLGTEWSEANETVSGENCSQIKEDM